MPMLCMVYMDIGVEFTHVSHEPPHDWNETSKYFSWTYLKQKAKNNLILILICWHWRFIKYLSMHAIVGGL